MKNDESDTSMSLQDRLISELEFHDIHPNTNLGQHFLVDESVIVQLASGIGMWDTVVEIGAGPGQITEVVAENAGSVFALELDSRYKPLLDEVAICHENVQIYLGDVLSADFDGFADQSGQVTIIGNLPYHITEPLFLKLAQMPPESLREARFMVGAKFASAIKANAHSIDFSRLTILVNTFFDCEVLGKVDKRCSYPPPRTDSALIRITQKEEYIFLENEVLYVLREVLRSGSRSTLLKNILENALVAYSEFKSGSTPRMRRKEIRKGLKSIADAYNNGGSIGEFAKAESSSVLTKNQARAIISSWELSERSLGKPVEQLNNNEWKRLYMALVEGIR